AAGVAVSVTCESLTKLAAQVAGQLTPAGADVTVPPPSPCRTTASVSMSFTATSTLPVLPKGSVTLIVAVPRAMPVTTPIESTVAIDGWLLVHVRPVPCTWTGTGDVPPAVPLPNCPNALSPQHQTEES